ncbi:MAG: hypothetical protein KatS3mg087_1349 [Patescibacteria group bacterium]|nr:MAG: hypothetical protein KatS3mg087_1349 [Patescibacteria group bacterium]
MVRRALVGKRALRALAETASARAAVWYSGARQAVQRFVAAVERHESANTEAVASVFAELNSVRAALMAARIRGPRLLAAVLQLDRRAPEGARQQRPRCRSSGSEGRLRANAGRSSRGAAPAAPDNP